MHIPHCTGVHSTLHWCRVDCASNRTGCGVAADSRRVEASSRPECNAGGACHE